MTPCSSFVLQKGSLEKASLFQKQKGRGKKKKDHPTQVLTFYKIHVGLVNRRLSTGVVRSFAAFLSPVRENSETWLVHRSIS